LNFSFLQGREYPGVTIDILPRSITSRTGYSLAEQPAEKAKLKVPGGFG